MSGNEVICEDDMFVQLAVTHVYEPVPDTSKLRYQLAVAGAQASESEQELQQIEDDIKQVHVTQIAHELCGADDAPMDNYSLQEPDAPDTFSQLQEAELEIAQLEERSTAHECTLSNVNEAVDALTDMGYELGDELQAERDKLRQCLKDYNSALDEAKACREARNFVLKVLE